MGKSFKNTENLVRKAVRSILHEAIVGGEKISFEDVPGYYAVKVEADPRNKVPEWDYEELGRWDIYQKSGGVDLLSGWLWEDDGIDIKSGKLVWFAPEDDIRKAGRLFGKMGDLHNAIRYVFMKRHERSATVSESSLNKWRNKQEGKVVSFPEVDGWTASKFHFHAYGNPKKSGDAWAIKNPEGYQAGTLYPFGLLTYTTEPGFPHNKKEKRFKGDLKRAVMFVFLKNATTKKKENLAEAEKIGGDETHGTKIEITEFPGWIARRFNTTKIKKWDIFEIFPEDPEDEYFLGSITDDGLLYVNLPHFKETGYEWMAGDPVQAARFIWLKRQQDIKQEDDLTEAKKRSKQRN